VAEWIIGFIQSHGLLAVALLMFLENVFPPLPSELIMPFAGFAAARGDMSLVLVTVAGAAGSVAGAVLWYWIGRHFGVDRLRAWTRKHGSLLAMSPQDVDKARDWFERRGTAAVFLGRLVPAVRTLISVPAGMLAMSLPKFLVWSTLGSLLWSGLLAGAGYFLGDRFDQATGWLDTATKVIVVALVAVYIWRVVKLRRQKS